MRLYYEDLPIEILYKYSDATWGFAGGSPEEWATHIKEVSFDYEADDNELETFLIELMAGKKEEDIPEDEWNDIVDYMKDNEEKLIEEYNKELLEHFREDAIKYAEENQDLFKNDDYWED